MRRISERASRSGRRGLFHAGIEPLHAHAQQLCGVGLANDTFGENPVTEARNPERPLRLDRIGLIVRLPECQGALRGKRMRLPARWLNDSISSSAAGSGAQVVLCKDANHGCDRIIQAASTSALQPWRASDRSVCTGRDCTAAQWSWRPAEAIFSNLVAASGRNNVQISSPRP